MRRYCAALLSLVRQPHFDNDAITAQQKTRAVHRFGNFAVSFEAN
ncbi:MAG: hypothetical protein ACXWF1_09540 [Chthoniobacterales bacterium]